MDGLTPKLNFSIKKSIVAANKVIDSPYDIIIDDLYTLNPKYNSNYCKTLFFYLFNKYATFEDGSNSTDIRGFELRLFDVEDENNEVFKLRTKYGAQKLDFKETETNLVMQSNMLASDSLQEAISSPDTVTSPGALDITINLSDFPVKSTIAISYDIDDSSSNNQTGTINDGSVNYEDSTKSVDVSSDQYIQSLDIDYVNKTVHIVFDSSTVSAVNSVSVNYMKPKSYDYFIYKAELWVSMNTNGALPYTFDPAPVSGVIERKLIEYSFTNLSFAESKTSKSTLPNKGLRIKRDTSELTNGYLPEDINFNAIYQFLWDKRKWA